MNTPSTHSSLPVRLVERLVQWLGMIPHSLIAFIARFSIAAVFW